MRKFPHTYFARSANCESMGHCASVICCSDGVGTPIASGSQAAARISDVYESAERIVVSQVNK